MNSHRLFGKIDWATAFSTRLIDYATNVERLIILRFFPQIADNSIYRVHTHQVTYVPNIRKVSQTLLRQIRQFTLSRFYDAADNFEEPRALFLDILGAAKVECVWIIDMLLTEPSSDTSEDTLALLRRLNELADDKNVVVKILITAPHGGASNSLSASLTECQILSS